MIHALLTVDRLAWHRGDRGPSHDREPEWITPSGPWCVQWVTLCRDAWTRRPPNWWLVAETHIETAPPDRRRHLQVAIASGQGVGADATVEADPVLVGAVGASRRVSLLRRCRPAGIALLTAAAGSLTRNAITPAIASGPPRAQSRIPGKWPGLRGCRGAAVRSRSPGSRAGGARYRECGQADKSGLPSWAAVVCGCYRSCMPSRGWSLSPTPRGRRHHSHPCRSPERLEKARVAKPRR